MAENKELKPCPFCGSTELDYGIYTGTLRGFTYIECENCGAEMKATDKNGYRDVVKAWNRRTEE